MKICDSGPSFGRTAMGRRTEVEQKAHGIAMQYHKFPVLMLDRNTGGRVHTGEWQYLHKQMFESRVILTAKTLLYEASLRANAAGKKAFVHVVGFGVGEWAIKNTPLHNRLFALAFEDAIRQLPKHVAEHVGWVDMSWIDDPTKKQLPDPTPNPDPVSERKQPFIINSIKVTYSKRDPQTMLKGDEYKNSLLVVSYAWDGNSWPGNEFYAGMLHLSGDPAAASCSMISELHNPFINADYVNGKKKVVLDAERAW